jgi:polyisoprenoid-binding protein YceI
MATAYTAQQSTGTMATWQIDPAASRVEFSINKRLMLVRRLVVTGRFADVSGTIVLDETDPTDARVEVTIGANSIDTQLARRDKHLRTADFFHVERFPALSFKSRAVEVIDRSQGRYRVIGDLTVRDTTREVQLDVQYRPEESRSASRRRFRATTTLNRRDFGLTWNRTLIQIADEARITLDVEATRV